MNKKDKGEIAYKVVMKKKRCGSNETIFRKKIMAEAKGFIEFYSLYDVAKIIRVRGFNRIMDINLISNCGGDPTMIIDEYGHHDYLEYPPNGTVAYKYVITKE